MVVYSERDLEDGSRIKVVSAVAGAIAMISLAGRDILHSWGKFVLTGLGLGLLIGVTFTMAGVYRGMVDDAKVLLDNSGADLWVVQKDTLGPYAESSSIRDDVYRGILGHARRGAGRQRDLPHHAGAQRRHATCVPWWWASSPGSPASRATWWRAGTSRAVTTRRWPT